MLSVFQVPGTDLGDVDLSWFDRYLEDERAGERLSFLCRMLWKLLRKKLRFLRGNTLCNNLIALRRAEETEEESQVRAPGRVRDAMIMQVDGYKVFPFYCSRSLF